MRTVLRETAGLGTRTAHDPGDPLITSHCPFCGSGQVIGRSDGTIGCDFCGQNYIVRVQPAFPGMPQMPNGPGAPSDIGPDGGLVDPGMVGPDGMPMDEEMPGDESGMPPGMDPGEEDGGGMAEDEGDQNAPPPPVPPAGDSKKDSKGSGPPPKGDSKKDDKSKKKPAARKKGVRIRTYYGLGGQVLTEDQFARHMAIALSGGHPAVLAAVRREAALTGTSR
jgi:hypothetical protein